MANQDMIENYGVTKASKKIFCEWCQHSDKYLVGDYDQPTCNKCSRFIKK